LNNLKNNKMKKHIQFFVAVVMMLTLTHCKKDKTTTPEPAPMDVVPGSGSLNFYIKGMVGSTPLVFSTQTYTNQAGNTYKINMAKYYISNIKLTKTDNSVYTVSNSYYLIDLTDSLKSMAKLSSIPFGNYKSIEFMIGVDSLRNVSGAQTGGLDPSLGMFWTWSTGYIMAKIEGTSPQSPDLGNAIEFHIGGFSGVNNVLRTTTVSFGLDTAKVSATVTPLVYMSSNLAEWFASPNMIDFSSINIVTIPGARASSIATNYMDMFSVSRIQN
jgi:hypothetical protein